MSARRPSRGRPPTTPGKRPVLPEVAIRRAAARPGRGIRIGKGGQRMIFGHRIIQIKGIPVRKFNWKEKKVIK